MTPNENAFPKALTEPQKAEIVTLLAASWTVGAIARKTGHGWGTVKRLSVLPDIAAVVDQQRVNLAEELQGLATRLVCSMDDAVIDKMGGRDRLIAAGVAIDKSRLIMGESTDNISVSIGTLQTRMAEAGLTIRVDAAPGNDPILSARRRLLEAGDDDD